ncbi:MAG: HesA/MoeB/ThiF family protein [Gammaproteobacteria bacterium]|nr:MAG: HesA/MoeB/ThiF family protein [Gammaproteobacteria bacterium]UCH41424.1 MAG: HesA/MoeB/ThiF family protein [Gammaproteobacteria bacterium]
MNQQQKDRYARHMRLSQIGEKGQQAILDASALIVGVGGLGSPAAMYLAAAGIGKLILNDYDIVETSNLQRQIIHRNAAVGEDKVESGRRTVEALNPECQVEVISYQMEFDELREAVDSVDIVLDCTDNYPTRFDINRACVETATPLVIGAAIRLEGQIMNYQPAANSACYQCLYTHAYGAEESCELEGVLGPVVGVVGTMQAVQTLLILAGQGEALENRLLLFDAYAMEWQSVTLPKNPDCPACGKSK